jgi:hypothetical protein
MSCTDPEFAESMRRGPERAMFGEQSPFGAAELQAASAPAIALNELADAIATATHAERANAPLDRRDAYDLALADARAKAGSLNPDGVSGVWVGLGMPFRYGRPRAAVCFDCGWVGRVTWADHALAEALAHRCAT